MIEKYIRILKEYALSYDPNHIDGETGLDML